MGFWNPRCSGLGEKISRPQELSLHQQGREVATRATKSGAGVDAGRGKSGNGEQSGRQLSRG